MSLLIREIDYHENLHTCAFAVGAAHKITPDAVVISVPKQF